MRNNRNLLFILGILAQKYLVNGFDLVILHNSDMHARFEEHTSTLKREKCGGFARVLHVIKGAREAAKAGGPPVLYLNGGDTYSGTTWFFVHTWKIAVEFMNLLEPDAVSLGNHEFDKGIEGLVPFVNAAKFPIIAANLDFKDEPDLKGKIKPSVILEVKGQKVGVIGYLLPDTKILSITGRVKFSDEVKSIKKESEKLNSQGVSIIIVLGHSGYLMDKKIAAEVPLVDIVVGGHTNTFLWNGPQPDKEKPVDGYPTVVVQKSGKKVPVVQAYAYTKYIGILHTVFDAKGNLKSFKGQPMFLNKQIPQDKDALTLLEKFRPDVEKLYTEVVGKSYVYLGGDDCRIGECNLGNLVVDSFVNYKASTYKGQYWTDASIAVMNGGAVRGSIDKTESDGVITKGNILGVLPFGGRLLTIKMSGTDLLRSLEIGVRSNGETSGGEFLQVSGLHIVYDISLLVGERVVQAKALCSQCRIPVYETIIPEKQYGVIVTEFLLSGGDAHEAIRENNKSAVAETVVDAESTKRYISLSQNVYPAKDERIVVLGNHSYINKPNVFICVSFLLCIRKQYLWD